MLQDQKVRGLYTETEWDLLIVNSTEFVSAAHGQLHGVFTRRLDNGGASFFFVNFPPRLGALCGCNMPVKVGPNPFLSQGARAAVQAEAISH